VADEESEMLYSSAVLRIKHLRSELIAEDTIQRPLHQARQPVMIQMCGNRMYRSEAEFSAKHNLNSILCLCPTK